MANFKFYNNTNTQTLTFEPTEIYTKQINYSIQNLKEIILNN